MLIPRLSWKSGGDSRQRLVDYLVSKTAELTRAALLDEKAKLN